MKCPFCNHENTRVIAKYYEKRNVAEREYYERQAKEKAKEFYNHEKDFGIVPKSQIIDSTKYNWEDDKPLNIPMADTIIYEMHVKAFTYDKSSGVKNPGTYLGVIEKIPYLKFV